MPLLLLQSEPPPSYTPPAGEWTFEVYSPSGTRKAVLDPTATSRVFDAKFRDPYRGIGTGQFYLQNDDADLANIAEGDIVRCYKGTTAVFAFIVQSKVRHSVAKAAAVGVPSGEKHTEISGQSVKAIGARSPIRALRGGQARPKETTRPFDWTSPLFDFSSWSNAGQIKRVDEDSEHWRGTPQHIVDNRIYWIGDVGADDDDAAAGVRLLRPQRFTLTDAATVVTFVVWIDNEGLAYLNGTQIMAIDTFHEARYIDLTLPPGDYDLALFGRNLEPTALSAGNNPFAFAYGVYKRTSDGAFLERIMVSDSSAKILTLPSTTPGLPAGKAVRLLKEEAQGRGEIPNLGIGFTDTTSTNSATFPSASDIGAVIGETFADYLLALEDSFADVVVTPDLELQMYYPRGSRSTATGVTFTEGTSLHKLDHELRDDRVTGLLIDYDGGYVEVGTGPYFRTLRLSQVSSEDAAIRIGTEVLAGRGTVSIRYAADIHTGAGREPYDDFNPGDTVQVDDPDAALADVTVQAIIFAVDRAGKIKWGGEFGDPLEPLDTVANRAVRRLAAMRGATNVQNALPSISGSGGQVYQQQVQEFSYEPSDLQISQKNDPPSTRDIAFLSVVLNEADTEDHLFVVRVNGTPLSSINVTIPTGSTDGRSWADIGQYRVVGGEFGDKVTLDFSGQPIRFTAKLNYR